MKQVRFALDLGTTKFCLATLDDGSSKHLKTISVPASGMRRGMIADFSKASHSLSTVLDLGVKEFGTDIARTVVGVAGSHLSGRTVSTSVDLPVDRAVDLTDITALIQKTEHSFRQPGKEILHTVPTSYQVNGRPQTLNPIGHSGKSLTGTFFLIEASALYLKDVITLCNQCGIEIARIYAEPFASAIATLDEERKELGVVLCDIGGGTTDGLIFLQGIPIHIFTVNIGGRAMTHDLSLGLNLPFEEAEQIKIANNLILPTSDFTVPVTDVNGNQSEISSLKAQAILFPRIVELGKYIDKNINPWKAALGAGLVLTGGGSESWSINHHQTLYASTSTSTTSQGNVRAVSVASRGITTL